MQIVEMDVLLERIAPVREGRSTMSILADRLKNRRNELGLTQKDFAAQLGMSQNQYSRYENGQDPKPDLISVMAKTLKCTADYLLGLTDEPMKIREEEHLPIDERNIVYVWREYKQKGTRLSKIKRQLLSDLDVISPSETPLVESGEEPDVPSDEEASQRKVV